MRKKIIMLFLIILVFCSFLFASSSKEEVKQKGSGGVTDGSGDNSVAQLPLEANNPRTNNTNAVIKYWIKEKLDSSLVYELETEDNITQPLTAIGERTIYTNNETLDTFFDEQQTSMATWMDNIGSAINKITMSIVAALHPFPSTLFTVYDLEQATNGINLSMNESNIKDFKLSYLPLTTSYYDSNEGLNKVLTIIKNSEAENGKAGFAIAENQEKTEQKAKWSLITLLFVTFFVAEVFFTAIWNYVNGSSENVLKDIAKKAGITLALFVLVAALPFLLEAMRYGLFKTAQTFYGNTATRYYNEAGLKNPLTKNTEIFNLPGAFLSEMKPFFTKINKNNTDAALTEAMEDGKGKNTILKNIVVWLVFLVYRFFMFFVVLKATIHIMINIVEVYLLLGMVMILIPFSVFQPTKKIGENCIYSLTTNLIECFVIMVMILCLIPSITVVCFNVLENATTYSSEETVQNKVEIKTFFTQANTFQGRIVASDKNSKITKCENFLGKNFYLLTLPYHTTKEKVNDEKKAAWDFSVDPDGTSLTLGLYLAINDDGSYNESGYSSIDNAKFEKLKKECEIMGVDYLINLAKAFSKIGETNEDLTWDWINSNLEHIKTSSDDINIKTKETSKWEDINVLIKTLNTAIPTAFDKVLSNGTSGIISCLNNENNRVNFLTNLSALETDSDSAFPSSVSSLNMPLSISVHTAINRFTGNEVSKGGMTFSDFEIDFDDIDVSSPSLYKLNLKNSAKQNFFFLQLCLIFIGLYLPSFFVQQSTQITNALMLGSAGPESFANALGGSVHQTLRGIAAVGRTVASTVGNISKGLSAIRNQLKAQEGSGGNSGNSGNTGTTPPPNTIGNDMNK